MKPIGVNSIYFAARRRMVRIAQNIPKNQSVEARKASVPPTVFWRKQCEASMSTPIPEDVMKAAREAVREIFGDPLAPMEPIIARALQARDERAAKILDAIYVSADDENVMLAAGQ